jgi:hypothetical protein
MIHEKIVLRDKQSIESKSSNRSMREIRRESVIISTNEIKDEFDATSTSYHIQNLDQLKYWLKKNETSVATTWTNMRNEHAAFFNQLNKKIDEMNELTKNYNTQANKLHDVILIIRELRVEQRERNATNSNMFLSTVDVKNECPPLLPRTSPKFHIYHLPPFIAAPPFSVKILHRRGISLIRSLISSIVILSHSSNIICFSSAMISHLRLLMRCLSIFHAASDGFKSGDCGECDNVLIQLTALKRTTTLSFDRVPWLLSLSSCKRQYLSRNTRFSLIKFAYTDSNRSV